MTGGLTRVLWPLIQIDDTTATYTEDRQSWRRGWLCVCRSAELKDAGMQGGYSILAEGILAVRDRQGKIGSYVNACRHRGHELVPCGAGALRTAIWCSYHSWSYHLNGQLRTAPGFGDLAERQPEEMGLLRVRSCEWNGWLFVNLAGEAASFDDLVSRVRVPSEINPASFLTMRCSTRSVPVNWKSVVQAFIRHPKSDGRKHDGSCLLSELDELPAKVGYRAVLANLLIVGYDGHVAAYRVDPQGQESTNLTYELLSVTG
jgi:glycine betaine catabolism A